MVEKASYIWRDSETEFTPASGKHKPVKSEIREWGDMVENHLFNARKVSQAASLTIAATDAGKTFSVTAAAVLFTVPAASTLGTDFTFFISVPSAATYGARVVSNSSEFPDFMVMPGTFAIVYADGNAMQFAKSQLRWQKKSGNVTCYVDSVSGDDTNDGLTFGRAFRTINKAAQFIWHECDHRGNLPEIFISGDFTEGLSLTNYGQLTGASTCYITGYNTTKFTWRPSGGYCFQFGDNSIAILSYIKFDGTGTVGSIAVSGHQTGVIDFFAGIEFGSFPQGVHINGDTDCKINFQANYAISGDFYYHVNITGGISVQFPANLVITVTNSPTFLIYYRIIMAGNNIGHGASTTWSGAFTAGGQQWVIDGPSALYVAGNTIPGSVAGATAHGGQQF